MQTMCSHLKVFTITVVHRLVFAATTLPKDTPKLWDIAASFAKIGAVLEDSLTPEKAKTLFENIKYKESDTLHSTGPEQSHAKFTNEKETENREERKKNHTL